MAGVVSSVGASEIAAEARYLAQARVALRRMRAEVVATETPEFVSGTDEVWFNAPLQPSLCVQGAPGPAAVGESFDRFRRQHKGGLPPLSLGHVSQADASAGRDRRYGRA